MYDDIYGGLDRAEIGEGGRYIGTLGVGQFSFRVIRMLTKQTRKSGLCTIGELELIESCNPNERLGQKITWMQSHLKDPDMALKAIKAFCAALYGFYHPEDKDRIERELNPHVVSLMRRAVSPENVFSGKCITADNYMHTTKETKKDIVLPRWCPFEGEEPPPRVEIGASSATHGQPSTMFVPPVGTPGAAYPVQALPGQYGPPPAYGPPPVQPPPFGQGGVPVPQGWPSHVPVPPGMASPVTPGAPMQGPPHLVRNVWGGPDAAYPPQSGPAPAPAGAPPPVIWNPATGRYEIVR